MEFPETGKQCAVKTCKQMDFLPFTCHHCQLIFCKEHSLASSHNCDSFVDKYVTEKTKTTTYECTKAMCETRTPCKMLCVQCGNNFCLAHRFHGCIDPTQEEKEKELEKWLKPRREFQEAKKVVDEEVARNLKKSKNVAMANKVQLMKLKGKSIGQNWIPVSERRYFLVYYPLDSKSPVKSKGVFVNVRWTVGKVIDYISELLNIRNSNNSSSATKLRLFSHISGMVIAETMDTKLDGLFESGTLTDGQSVVLEYSDSREIDVSNYK